MNLCLPQYYKRQQIIKKRVTLTSTQLNKLKHAAKNKTKAILRLNKKNFQDEELQHELFLTTIQTTKIGIAFANSMSTDIKLSKAQISKINQSGGSFGSWLGNLARKALTNICYSFIQRQFTWISEKLNFKRYQ